MNLRSASLIPITFFLLHQSLAQDASERSPAAPPSVYISHGACPFECCTYREWWTTAPVTLVDKPGSTQVIARLVEGEHVQALTGEVHVEPLRLVASQDYKEPSIRKGEVFWLLDPEGEGFFRIWLRGKTEDFPASPDLSNKDLDRRIRLHSKSIEWWAKIRTKSGITGWTKQTNLFANQDRCG